MMFPIALTVIVSRQTHSVEAGFESTLQNCRSYLLVRFLQEMEGL